MWTITDALNLIRDLQLNLRKVGYHLALGGGVLNRGGSAHDLDLYLLPIYNKGTRDFAAALNVFTEWGWPLRKRLDEPGAPFSASDGPMGMPGRELRYYVLYITEVDGQKIDLFTIER